jgi:hypothetical protein
VSQSPTSGALRAARKVQSCITGIEYAYHVEHAAAAIDHELNLPELVGLVNELVEHAKKELGRTVVWTGTDVQVPFVKLKELASIVSRFSE